MNKNSYILPLYNRLEVGFVKGKKSILYDEKGKNYVDFASGVGVNSLGYANKKVVKTIKKQANKIVHSSNIYQIKSQEKCAKKIVELSSYDMKCFFCNSGAEANESAIKLARKYGNIKFKTPKYKIITIKNSFHGRTIATLKATAQEDKHKYFAPYPDGFVYANDINEAINMIDDSTVAVMLELILGEGGILMQDIHQVKELEKVLKEKKLLLIIDEVQTGVYRSGNFLLSQYFGIKPDIVTLAKGLASGIPIGLMMTSLKNIFTFGDHGSTFGGNHLSTTVCSKVLNILEKYSNSGELNENIKYFNSCLQYIINKYPNIFIKKSGFGFMQGLVLKDENLLNDIINLALKNGVLVLKSGNNIIRFLPPIIITKSEITEGFQRFEDILFDIK
ncbi:acetylornithine transaminase [Aliarcobacter thereius]|uniref:Acetylornithine aminotransferase n=1 Tax=Aliarcobacter thereius LMG 24486 TaxID=1032240 RepID=A0A1C7WR57_9BACT|nr:acetylornithine transaminase [Aliarcobacter thereius]OCL90138.1 Acetylornithine aminotransferase [Aliarcobacter thereius]OCL96261.1 Acetylornithine aminotransferase [Aliarcobacter thereius LMG 24486]QBF15774.1 N-succinyldiaminopimelate-aminotransferase / acetylornithine transaminase [Aliarcobacter thereius LMG 24486]TLS92447.1 aminotransferase class III-fold pyridoxal phosphate-dependent enzyme [Aliarcobacter thereius]HJE03928.1 acetylornithine transaminase [Aliarcobacter thereius]